MRTREEIMAVAAAIDAQSKASHLTVLEVLLDIRGEFVRQGGQIADVGGAAAELKRKDEMIFQLQNAAIEMAQKLKALEGAPKAPASKMRELDQVLGVASMDEYRTIVQDLISYLGVVKAADVMPGVKAIASELQDLKAKT